MTDAPKPTQPDGAHCPHRCPKCGSFAILGRNQAHGRTWSGGRATSPYDHIKTLELFCKDCEELEIFDEDQPEYRAFVKRWENPVYAAGYTREELRRDITESVRKQDEFERNRTWPGEPNSIELYKRQREEALREDAADNARSYFENHELLAQILANPDDDALRWEYAAWMREQPVVRHRLPPDRQRAHGGAETYESITLPTDIAWFVETQLTVHATYRADPKVDVTHLLKYEDFQASVLGMRGGFAPGYGRYELGVTSGFTDSWYFVRGFIEHLAVKAKAFLPFADFLYSLVPVRHLTLTYCPAVIDELVASPHLARIHTLDLPNRMLNNHYTRLNELTDDHLRVLAASPHLGKLAYLDLEDNTALTPRGLDHLALSPHLPALSHVRHDVYTYDRVFGQYGDYQRRLAERRTELWRDELEARHGYLPWLHPDEHYGSPTPLFEAVTAHPVGRADFRPDVAARCRARLPAPLVAAIAACLTPEHTLRDRSLVATHAGHRLVATLERAQPDPDLDLRTLVTLTVQQCGVPIAAYDFASARNVELRPRATVTLGIPTPSRA